MHGWRWRRRSAVPPAAACAWSPVQDGSARSVPPAEARSHLSTSPARSPGRSAVPGDALRRCRSCRRELMPSLEKTLRRWYSEVRGLMNSRAPTSGFVRPSAASRMTCASCTIRACLSAVRSLSPGAPGGPVRRTPQPGTNLWLRRYPQRPTRDTHPAILAGEYDARRLRPVGKGNARDFHGCDRPPRRAIVDVRGDDDMSAHPLTPPARRT